MRKHISRKGVIFDEDVSGAMLPNGRGVSRGISRERYAPAFRLEPQTDVRVKLKNRSEHEVCNFVSNLCNLDSGNASPLGFVMVKWAGIELARGRIEVYYGFTPNLRPSITDNQVHTNSFNF